MKQLFILNTECAPYPRSKHFDGDSFVTPEEKQLKTHRVLNDLDFRKRNSLQRVAVLRWRHGGSCSESRILKIERLTPVPKALGEGEEKSRDATHHVS
jgi:hypothetical protein